MRTSLANPTRLGRLLSMILGVACLAGCGGSNDRKADSGDPSEFPSGLASVEVTYYYLPG